jgi:AcrR family transcriptional regulator
MNRHRRIVDRKEQILAEAGRLFSKKGYDAVTVKEIAAACSITEPAIYRHFESKDALYDAVLDSLRQRLDYQDLFAELMTETDVEKLLRSLAAHVIGFFSEHADLYRHLLYSALRGHARAKATYAVLRGTYSSFLKAQLDRLLHAGLIVKKNNEITARCFLGMVFDCVLGITLWKGMQGKTYRPADVIANNVPLYARGLRK